MPDRKPHLILFNPDQFRADAVSHLGGIPGVTPHLDAQVKEDAVSFAQAFCQNPVCTPSRCSFMSGWYPHVRGHRTMHHMMQPDEPVLLQRLKQEGYHVWWGGKNDLVPGQNGPQAFCDEYHRSQREITGYNLHQEDDWRGPPGGDNYYSFYAGRLTPKSGDRYVDDDWAHVLDAVDLIENYDGDKPLCIYLPILYPHPPYGVEEPFYSQIDRDRVPMPAAPYDDWSMQPSILRGIRDGQRLQNWDPQRLRELKATYLGMCARVDEQWGLLVKALKKSGRYDDSAMFFFSDHGDFTGDYGLVEKTQNTFQDCLTRVPFVIKPPASQPVLPRVSQALTELLDLPATVAHFAGFELGYSQFGRSLADVLAGLGDQHRDAVFCEGGRLMDEKHCSEYQSAEYETTPYMPRLRQQLQDGPQHGKAIMTRDSRYKYVYRLYEKDELYDLQNDPTERQNRIDDADLADQRQRLKERTLRHLLETCDVVPLAADQRNFQP